MSASTLTNKQIADEVRLVAQRGELKLILESIEIIGPEIVVRSMLLVVADLLDIHDETGVDLYQWPAAKALVELVSGDRIKPPGGKPRSNLVVSKSTARSIRA